MRSNLVKKDSNLPIIFLWEYYFKERERNSSTGAFIALILTIVIICFLPLQFINWLQLSALYRKLDKKEGYVTEEEAKKVLAHTRKIYFWLSSPYFFGRMRKIYHLVYASPKVDKEIKKSLRKSMRRRTVRGLAKVY